MASLTRIRRHRRVLRTGNRALQDVSALVWGSLNNRGYTMTGPIRFPWIDPTWDGARVTETVRGSPL
jgi:hypothetical protein